MNRSGLVKHGPALVISSSSQAVSSITNFLIMLYLVRILEKTAFGIYSLGFAVTMVAANLIVACIAVPYVVSLPDQPTEARSEYALHHAAVVFTAGLLLMAISVLIRFIPWPLAPAAIPLTALMPPVSAAVTFHALRDTLMRVAFSEHRESVVLAGTLSVAVGVVAAFGSLSVSLTPLVPEYALYVYAAGQAAGCITALFMLRLPLGRLSWKGVRGAFSDSFPDGRWNALSNAVYQVRTQAHNFVVASLLGLAALADLSAARVLVSPAIMVFPALKQVMMPRLAEWRAGGSADSRSMALLSVGILAGVATVYSAALLLFLPWILPFAFGPEYQNVSSLVFLWCGAALVLSVRNGLTMTLEVFRAFRDLLLANAFVSSVAVALAVFLCLRFGPGGAISAFAVAESLLCGVLFYLLRARSVKGERIACRVPDAG